MTALIKSDAADAVVPSSPVLQVQTLVTKHGRLQVLHGIDLTVDVGKIVALVGANGAGKTTLLRTISGVVPASRGKVFFSGKNITQTSPDQRVRYGICQVPEGRQVFGPMSVEDNLLLGAYSRRDRTVSDFEQVYEILPVLKEKRAQLAGTLSGGQQQMLAIGRALMGRPKLLLLDEPSMGLAPLLVQEVFATIQRLRKAGITILLVEQNARAALQIADKGYVLETGKIVAEGSGSELLASKSIQSAYLGSS